MPWAQVAPILRQESSKYSVLAASGGNSIYYHHAFQGATLNPHTLWFVESDPNVPLNVSRPLLRTQESAYRLCKEAKWKFRISGAVEKEFLFATALSEGILPFFVRDLTLVVLPILIHDGRLIMAASDEILGEGFQFASDWVKQAEEKFAKRSKDRSMTAQKRLNYQRLLASQAVDPSFVVLYNKSGTNISAALLSRKERKGIGDLAVKGFIAESVTYRIYPKSESEALYLVGVLNSSIVNTAIKPYQTEGVYHGKRDIHRRPFEVCSIPEFSPNDKTHDQIVELTRAARQKVAKWAHGASGGLAKVRELARELVADEIRGIDASVQTILSKPSTKEVVKSSEQTDLFQTDLQPEFHAYGQSYTSRQSRLPGDDSRRCILQVRGPLKRRG